MKEFEYMVRYQDIKGKNGIFYAYEKYSMIEEIQKRKELGIIETCQIYSIKYEIIL